MSNGYTPSYATPYQRIRVVYTHEVVPLRKQRQQLVDWLDDGWAAVTEREFGLVQWLLAAVALAFLCVMLGKATSLWLMLQAAVGLVGTGLTWLIAGSLLVVSTVLECAIGLLVFVLSSVQVLLKVVQQAMLTLLFLSTAQPAQVK